MSRPGIRHLLKRTAVFAAMAGSALWSAETFAEPLSYEGSFRQPYRVNEQILPDSRTTVDPQAASELASQLHRRIVNYSTREAPGTIVIDTPNTFLYYVLGDGRAARYGIGVGRQGFTWSGVKQVARKTEWPDWYPPQEMIARQPYLPRMVAGGPGNPLGARAMYLGGTEYRIHGTNDPTTIGKHVSSGCIRLTNEDVEDLYSRVQIGAKVIVLSIYSARAPDLAGRDRPVQDITQTAVANSSRARGLY
jgi:lipoprotein-anchoring transpeptidase ErfK/SrfK